MEVTLLQKGDRQGIGWVKKAARKDYDHPILNSLQLKNGVLSASDGFRMHRWIFPENSCLAQLPDGCYEITVFGKYLIFTQTEQVDRFPNLDAICSPRKLNKDQKQVLETQGMLRIEINPKFLAEAMSLPGNSTTFLASGTEQIISDQREDGLGIFFAMVMPKSFDPSRYSATEEIFDILPWNSSPKEIIREAITE